MPAIKSKDYQGGKLVMVGHKDYTFAYFKPKQSDIKRIGRRLEIGTRGRNQIVISLCGTEINTLKKVLKAAGEI